MDREVDANADIVAGSRDMTLQHVIDGALVVGQTITAGVVSPRQDLEWTAERTRHHDLHLAGGR